MKSVASLVLASLMLTALPASAQTLDTLVPVLTWPDDAIIASTKGCDPADQAVCAPRK